MVVWLTGRRELLELLSSQSPQDRKNPYLLLYLSRRVSLIWASRPQIVHLIEALTEPLQNHFHHLRPRPHFQHCYSVTYFHLSNWEPVAQALQVVLACQVLAEHFLKPVQNPQISSRRVEQIYHS